MGVPKFFRYISERYPCLSELIKADQVSDFDNLYLDMNGIIHMCSHPDDNNPHFRITEEKIFAEIFHYIAYLFQLIGPKKVFFMAIDGVAPRAKMNQQRGRRFRTAKDMQQQEEKAREAGEKLPEGKRFDSNCITPGTVFMARLQEQLRYFVKQKISTDSAWAKCRVVLSGHQTPGEGEHKIMEYIRYLKAQPDHDPNTRHCLYGLDADLIMLGLCSHEPNFSLLREEVKFGKNVQRASTPDENNFFLLHLSLLRDYLEQEFLALKEDLEFEYDMEKIVDDWVLMGFLVGNDFIPPLPHLHIHNDALPLLFDIYKTVIKKLDGYINEGGILNLKRFEVFMKELASLDKENFQETYADLKFFEEKTGRKPNEMDRKSYKNVPDNNDTFGMSVEEMKAEGTKPISAFQTDLQALIKSTNQMAVDDDEDKEWDDFNTDDEEAEDSCDDSEDRQFNAEFVLHKRDYYLNKLEYKKVTGDVLREQAECYVRAVQWVLHYYYQGCASWSWYYPHHYAPYISDVVNFKDMDLTYEMAKPFKPFEQLLAVLPAASKDLLPQPFHFLMTNDKSPILTYYPLEFETDLNGKKNDWEAVVVIPFINETNLLEAMQPFYEKLSEDETKRNTHGPMHIYDFTPQDLGECRAPEYFPLVRSCHARETPVWLRDIAVAPEQVVRGPLPNPTRGLLYPGIPTLRHLPFKSHFTKARVKVFDFPSRNDNCILELKHDNSTEPDIQTVASNLLGKVVWAGWPHLSQAKVVEVSNNVTRFKYVAVEKDFSLIEDDEIFSMSEDKIPNLRQWDMQKRTIVEHNMSRLGIDVGDVSTIVHAKSLKGYQYIFGPNGNMITGAEWCQVSSPYPYQAVIHKMAVAPMYSTRSLSVEEALPKGDKVFIKTGPYYGCIAEIVDSSTVQKLGRVKICVFMEPEPVVQPSKYAPPPTLYLPPGAAAAKCGVTSLLLSRLTGCIFVSTAENPDIGGRQQRTNIGLNIKFTKKNEEVTGYTRRVENRWLYSQKCIDLVNAYSSKYHEMFQCLAVKIEQDNFTEKDLFPNNIGDGKIKEITEWLKAQPYNRCSVRSCDSLGLEPEQIEFIKDTINAQQPQLESERKRLALQVKPHVLFKPELHLGTIPPDATAATFRLYDRVINVNPRSTVPLGLKGTVIAISQLQPRADTVKLSEKLNSEPIYQILFDKSFLGGINSDGINENRIFKMQGFNLLNITQGRILYNKANDKVQVNLKSSPSNTTPDSFKMLRTNDGHNSAFANYTSPTKNQMMTNDPGTSYTQQQGAPTLHYPTPKMQTTVDDSYTQLLKSLLRISDTKNTVVQHQGPPQLDNFFQPNYNRPQGDNNPPPPQAPQAPQAPPHFPPDNQNYLQMVHPNNTGYNPNFIPPMASDLPGFNKGNMQDNNGPRGIPSLQFYNTNTRVPPVLPPTNLQLPFPQKLIEHDNNQNAKFNNGTQQKVLSNVPAPFIPLQAVTRQAVTRSSAPIGNKNYKKNFRENKVVPSATEPDSQKETRAYVPPAAVQGSNAMDNRTKPAAPKKKKSRIAANFSLPQ